MHTWSAYQQAVFAAMQDPMAGSVIVKAVAGSGKTTTMVQGMHYVPHGARVAVLAFNSSIMREIKPRLPSGTLCKTFHGFGYGAVNRHNGSTPVEKNKTSHILRGKYPASLGLNPTQRALYEGYVQWLREALEHNPLLRDLAMFGSPDGPEQYLLTREGNKKYGREARKLTGIAKQEGIGALRPIDYAELQRLGDHHNLLDALDPVIEQWLLVTVCFALFISQHWTSVIDFDDMLWLPVLWGLRLGQYDLILVDEAQDTNPIQVAMLHAMLGPYGRVIAVGDPQQAIYGFRGASASAMRKVADAFDCRELPLSVSYRCPRSVVREAQRFSEQIEAFEGAGEGAVEHVPLYTLDSFGPDDAILCRNVAPLVRMAYDFFARGRGARFVGKDIGQSLVTLVKRIAGDTNNLGEFRTALLDWRRHEIHQLEADGQEDQIERVNDRTEAIMVILQALPVDRPGVTDLVDAIYDLFDEKDERLITLSTVHRAKGREWRTVYILDRHLIPSFYATQEWQLTEERNLSYVAVTRAKERLVYIRSNGWDDEKGQRRRERLEQRETDKDRWKRKKQAQSEERWWGTTLDQHGSRMSVRGFGDVSKDRAEQVRKETQAHVEGGEE